MEPLKEHFKFENLKVYQKALDFVVDTYQLSSNFPSVEKYGLTSQLNRAAVSMPLNVAEGYGASDKEFNRFLGIAHRSGNECVVSGTVSERLSYIDRKESNKLRSQVAELHRMIAGLKRSLNLIK